MTILIPLLCLIAGGCIGYVIARWRDFIRDGRAMCMGFISALGGGRE